MSEQIHLKNGFIHRHRLHIEGFDLYDRVLLIGNSGSACGSLIIKCIVKRIFSETLFKLGFVLAYLTLDSVNRLVECIAIGLVLNFASEKGTVVRNCDLQTLKISLVAEGN